MKLKKPSLGNLLFLVFILILMLPQTRKPMQVGLNQLKVALFSPCAFAKAEQPKLAPFDYALTTLDGELRNAKVGQGKVVFISYWATWCPPCIAELPAIQKLYADYGNRVDFLLISAETPEKIRNFLKKEGYNLPAFTSNMKTPELLKEASIPTTYIIDANGSIVVKEIGASNWNSDSIRSLLDRLIYKE